ncbi:MULTISPECIES: hypothetical protein [Nostocaceae]|uniref:hypothetical protein n=1 Tax=Nostocaceae TaxID=1162 RepID=UPI001786F46C|nr:MULTISPECIES: hypothetical protein [Nostocaceae]
MTKLSFNSKTPKIIVSDLGRIINCDSDFDAIAIRHEFISDDDKDQAQEVNSANQSEGK